MKKLTLFGFAAGMLLGSVHGVSAGGSHGHGHHGHGFHHGHGIHYGGHGFHHGHGGVRFSFGIGAPLFWDVYPYPYSSPYPYTYYSYRYRYPYPLERPRAYVQQPANYWYYCPNPSGYYPYVQNCPTEWMKVVPQSPPG
jgi:hypothetical protein